MKSCGICAGGRSGSERVKRENPQNLRCAEDVLENNDSVQPAKSAFLSLEVAGDPWTNRRR